jgi:hypothetical protein
MNDASRQQLIEAGLATGISYELLAGIARSEAMAVPDVLDELACYVANAYVQGSLSYEVAGAVMNSAFSVASSPEFLAMHDRTIPSITFEVYQAFDEGEYGHPGDDGDVDPELKYTRPLIDKFLAERNNGAKPCAPADCLRQPLS